MRLRALIAASACLTSCEDGRPDQWDAFVYPDRSDLTVHEEIKGFKSFELCQSAAIDRMSKVEVADGGDYECGYRCGRHEGFSGNICQETRK